MLILSRYKGQKIIINNGEIIVTVIQDGAQVKLGFEAPDDVTIDREEIFNRKQEVGSMRTLKNETIDGIMSVGHLYEYHGGEE